MSLNKISEFLRRGYPQNYILKNPLTGSLSFALICFLFLIIYRPSESHASSGMSYPLTMALYCFAISLFIITAVTLIKKISLLSDSGSWSVKDEIIANLILLFLLGVSAYLAGFLIEESSGRLNFTTIYNSFINALLLGSAPLLTISLINGFNSSRYNHVLPRQNHSESNNNEQSRDGVVTVISKLKRERLTFNTKQFVYAKADGNYVEFYLKETNGNKKVIIRNFINETELQFSQFTHIMRVHRKYLVNLKEVELKKGNALSLKIRVTGEDREIPVSRNNIKLFNQLLESSRN